jgi:SAM-dependent methyltransferase
MLRNVWQLLRTRGLRWFLNFVGIDPHRGKQNLKSLNWYFRDYASFRDQLEERHLSPSIRLNPFLADKFDTSGSASGHYFHQDLYVARRILRNAPVKHVDIGSRIDGFVAHVAIFRPIEVFDIRPLTSQIENITFVQADFTNIDPRFTDYTDSVSCLHSIEHFGLGRYNDRIDVNGHEKGLQSIYQILKPGGRFYFSTLMGREKVDFNAERIFPLRSLLELIRGKYAIEKFSYVDDRGDFHQDVPLTDELIETNCSCHYGCAIFELLKTDAALPAASVRTDR